MQTPERMTDDDSKLGTTALINNRLVERLPDLNAYKLDRICNVLDQIKIAEYLKGLIADVDEMEVVAVLDLELEGKSIKVFDDNDNQIYPVE